MSQYGKFHDFCRDSGNGAATIPVCNFFDESRARGGVSPYFGQGGCELTGIKLSGDDRYLANLGSILVNGLAIFITLYLLWRSQRKKAAVGRREMQYFLLGFIIIEICAIFSIGGFPLSGPVRRAFSAVHVAAVTADAWILMLNGVVGYQMLDDGTFLSMALLFGSSAVIFIGTGFIALATGFSWTNEWRHSVLPGSNQNYALYTLYFLAPLVFIVIYFVLETYLVLKVLAEVRPMLYLCAAGLLFAIGQIFQFVISVHICNGTHGAINGGFFESLFTMLSVITIWIFWSSITEDDWPVPASGGSTYT